MRRQLEQVIRRDLKQKMVFLAGPRQCGKTTLALKILGGNESHERYLNWDTDAGREAILTRVFPAGSGLLVLDELHKFSRWRNLLKGLFDGRRSELEILVTGSARLDLYRRGGDSLQGRYHLLRMHPLAFWELESQTQATLERMLQLGGFPEPFFGGSEVEARRWSRAYRTRVIREEVAALEKITDLTRLEELSVLLPSRVGSPYSINSLREDLEVSHTTVGRWLTVLENLYQIYRTYPFGSPKIRAVKKEAKLFFYDWSLVSDPGARFENLIGSHLLNFSHWQEDVLGWNSELRYFRDREQREVDFVHTLEGKPNFLVECKLGRQDSTQAIRYLKARFPAAQAIQVCLEPKQDQVDRYGVRLCDALTFLKDLGQKLKSD